MCECEVFIKNHAFDNDFTLQEYRYVTEEYHVYMYVNGPHLMYTQLYMCKHEFHAQMPVLGRALTKKIRGSKSEVEWDPETEGLTEMTMCTLRDLQYRDIVNSDFCQYL